MEAVGPLSLLDVSCFLVQVRCRINEMVYAMKVVDKASIERYRSMDNIATELSILRTHAEARHPFILGLECAFQSPSKLHFVMEYVPGGMLFAHLRSHEMFSEKMARCARTHASSASMPPSAPSRRCPHVLGRVRVASSHLPLLSGPIMPTLLLLLRNSVSTQRRWCSACSTSTPSRSSIATSNPRMCSSVPTATASCATLA